MYWQDAGGTSGGGASRGTNGDASGDTNKNASKSTSSSIGCGLLVIDYWCVAREFLIVGC